MGIERMIERRKTVDETTRTIHMGEENAGRALKRAQLDFETDCSRGRGEWTARRVNDGRAETQLSSPARVACCLSVDDLFKAPGNYFCVRALSVRAREAWTAVHQLFEKTGGERGGRGE